MRDVIEGITAQLDRVPLSRFAPSPTGYLHLGHLVNAICTWGITHALGGKVILRLEDHDRGRCRPEYEAAILEDLEWLGLLPDIGTVEAFRAGATRYRQRDNAAAYDSALAQLMATDHVYGCDCSRKTILARAPQTNDELCYDGFCRDRALPAEVPHGTRMWLPSKPIHFDDAWRGPQTQTPAEQCGDILLRDRHGNWTYHFAVTVDDLDQGVNLVIRGEDLLASTGRQILLSERLGRVDPPVYLHHPLITDPAGRKLSKRDFDKALRDYRAEGASPEEVLTLAAQQAGLIEAGRRIDVGELPGIFA